MLHYMVMDACSTSVEYCSNRVKIIQNSVPACGSHNWDYYVDFSLPVYDTTQSCRRLPDKRLHSTIMQKTTIRTVNTVKTSNLTRTLCISMNKNQRPVTQKWKPQLFHYIQLNITLSTAIYIILTSLFI